MDIYCKVVCDGETLVDGNLKGFFGITVRDDGIGYHQNGSINGLEQVRVILKLREMSDRMVKQMEDSGYDFNEVARIVEVIDSIGNEVSSAN